MGFLENHYIYNNNPFSANIVFFGGYIDDLIIISDGTSKLISSFIIHCNDNTYGLSFNHESNMTSLAFMDLELGHDEHNIYAKNYTKPKAGISYLHFKSWHYPKWITNMPKGQFCHLRQNCTRDTDYIELSAPLKVKFLEKEYPESLVNEAYHLYLHGKPPKTNLPPRTAPEGSSLPSTPNTKKWKMYYLVTGTFYYKTHIWKPFFPHIQKSHIGGLPTSGIRLPPVKSNSQPSHQQHSP